LRAASFNIEGHAQEHRELVAVPVNARLAALGHPPLRVPSEDTHRVDWIIQKHSKVFNMAKRGGARQGAGRKPGKVSEAKLAIA
jgi:hypothetical protein